jgi:soluble lytic murein transglycosylase-like protein
LMQGSRGLLTLAVLASFAGGSAASGVFSEADSLALSGETALASSALMGLLGKESVDPDEVLYRLLGLYHGCGEEMVFVGLLDSLGSEGWASLSGWAVSAMDLARHQDSAIARASGDPLLCAFLSGCCRDSMLPGTVLPRPEGIAGRYVRVMLAQPGTLTSDQLKFAVEDAASLPSLVPRIVEELEAGLISGGKEWDEALAGLEMCPGGGTGLLRIRRMLATRTFEADFLEACLDSSAEVACLAAAALVVAEPSRWSSSFRIADALAGGGDLGTLEGLIDGSADPFFRTGAAMALLRARGRPSELLSIVAAVGDSAPDSLRARASLFRARGLRDSGRDAEAWLAYEDFSASWPGHPSAAEAARLAALRLDGERDWRGAAEDYLLSLRCSGDFEADETAFWRGGFSFYMCGERRLADSLWRAGSRSFPGGFWEDEILFWTARNSAESGRAAESNEMLRDLVARHPWEFYGLLAAARSGGSPGDLPGPCLLTRPGSLPRPAVELVASGYGRLAVEMLSSSRVLPAETRAAALSLLGENRKAFEVLTALDARLRGEAGTVLPESLLCYYFPAPYAHLASSTCSMLSFGPDMLLGIMREESSFDRFAFSSAGAKGLIQLMPGTASDVARWNGLDRLSGDDFFDPSLSARYGSLYIDRQWRNYSGNAPPALAAYNAGPGNASRWVESIGFDDADPELFIEQITFRETRNYVKKVLRSAWMYRRFGE